MLSSYDRIAMQQARTMSHSRARSSLSAPVRSDWSSVVRASRLYSAHLYSWPQSAVLRFAKCRVSFQAAAAFGHVGALQWLVDEELLLQPSNLLSIAIIRAPQVSDGVWGVECHGVRHSIT